MTRWNDQMTVGDIIDAVTPYKMLKKWLVTYQPHDQSMSQRTLIVRGKNKEDATNRFYETARGHDKLIKIEAAD